MNLPQRSVTMHLAGGLGNQMFQYAFGRRLSSVNGAALFLDTSGYRAGAVADYQSGVRVCELPNFAVVGTFVGDGLAGGSPAGIGPKAWLGRKILKWWGLLRAFSGQWRPYYLRGQIVEPEENHFRFDPRVYQRSIRGSVTVRGYWQTEKYFADIGEVIRRELVVRHELSGKNLRMAEAIDKSLSVCVHVRHGDNAHPMAAGLGVLPRAYYEHIVGELDRALAGPRFFVFSDDIPWARAVLPANINATYVEHNRGAHSYEDLRLMSMGKHHVVANSTFGWWGAWLGKKQGQIVYAPRRYYQNIDRPNPDLYPPDWRLM